MGTTIPGKGFGLVAKRQVRNQELLLSIPSSVWFSTANVQKHSASAAALRDPFVTKHIGADGATWQIILALDHERHNRYSIEFAFVWFGLVQIGLVWFGLVWFSLSWVGLFTEFTYAAADCQQCSLWRCMCECMQQCQFYCTCAPYLTLLGVPTGSHTSCPSKRLCHRCGGLMNSSPCSR